MYNFDGERTESEKLTHMIECTLSPFASGWRIEIDKAAESSSLLACFLLTLFVFCRLPPFVPNHQLSTVHTSIHGAFDSSLVHLASPPINFLGFDDVDMKSLSERFASNTLKGLLTCE